VDNLLLESEGHVVFAREGLKRAATKGLTVQDCHAAYVEFCTQRGWTALTKNKFTALMSDAVVRQFGITSRNDIPDGSGKQQRGWKGLELVAVLPRTTEENLSEMSEPQSRDLVTDSPDTISPVLPGNNAASADQPLLTV
jgi:hypothetical protein